MDAEDDDATTPVSLADASLMLPGILENPDDPRLLEIALTPADQASMEALERRIAARGHALPSLPGNSLALVRLACDIESDVDEIVAKLERDPPLASAVLSLANSVQNAGHSAIETLPAAVIRIGLNPLRSVVVSCALRQAVFAGGRLPEFARQVWRQAYSCGNIARVIYKAVGSGPEIGFVRGLLHDLGKVSLLASFHEVHLKKEPLSRRVVAHAFARWHEAAGRALAESWALPRDLRILAGAHEDPAIDELPARTVRLAHRLDLILCLGWVERFRALGDEPQSAPELQVFGFAQEPRESLLLAALSEYRRAAAEFAPP